MPGIKGGLLSIGATGAIGKGKKSRMGIPVEAPAPPPTPFEIGSAAIDRPTHFGIVQNTVLNKANPAELAGIITEVNVFVNTAGEDNLFVGIFFNTGGDNWTCRSAANEAVPGGAGLKTISGLALDCQVGDCVAIFWKNASPDMTADGEDDTYISYSVGNLCSPASSGAFPDWIAAGKHTVSLGALGETL
ncbi:hypothetical protein ES705_22933 [subsurface metagenome]